MKLVPWPVPSVSRFVFQEQLPDLHSHFCGLNLEAHMYASQWFLTLFTAKFPLCMVFHIIDLLLCEVRPRPPLTPEPGRNIVAV